MTTADTILHFEKSARKDVRWWLLLIVGAMFSWGGLTIDPQTNCASDGACAPWLVPIAAVMGIGALTMALGLLIGNPRRGSTADFRAGTLRWWEGQIGSAAREAGEIPLASIARITVIRESDSDSIHFYGQDGGRLPLPDGEILPWPYDRWAERLVAGAPHIRLAIESR